MGRDRSESEGRTYDLLRKSVLPTASQPEIHGLLRKPEEKHQLNTLACAMFHLSVKPISRSAGRTATAAAAYRSGSLIVDERTGELHDYTRKRDVVQEGSGIVLPPGAPAWAEDRAALWNAAEAAEKRKDARVARDYEVAIPKELTKEQGIALVRDFAQGLVDRYGVAVDYNIHRDDLRKWDGSEKGWQGYHAHVLTSTRKLGREGFGEKAEIELSDAKRKSLGLGDGASEIERVREMWEVAANRHLEQANQAQRIDRRSLKDQGIDRDPTVHLGPGVTALERDGVSSRLGDINRQVVTENRVDRQHAAELKVLQPQIDALEQGVQAQVRQERGAETEIRREPAQRPVDDHRPLTADEIRIIHEAVDAALTKIRRERDQRVQRVLAKAQVREQRREKALQTVEARRPIEPRGLLATFQQKGHEQAVLAWQATKDAAAKLVQQAKRLGQRLLEARTVRQLMHWSQGALKREQPELVVRWDEAVRQNEANARSRQLQEPQLQKPQPQKAPQLESDERVPFWLEPGFDPKTFVATNGRADRQAEPPVPSPEAPPKDIKTEAAEGVAAFRARREKERQRPREKTVAEQMAERLKAQIEAEQKGAEQKRQAEQERSRDRGKDRGGPSW